MNSLAPHHATACAILQQKNWPAQATIINGKLHVTNMDMALTVPLTGQSHPDFPPFEYPKKWPVADGFLIRAGAIRCTKNGTHSSTAITLIDDERLYAPIPHNPCAEEVITPDLTAALTTVAHAISTDETRYVLNGIHVEDGYCVATDGRRLATAKTSYRGIKHVIPAAAVRIIQALAKDSSSYWQWQLHGDSPDDITSLTLTTPTWELHTKVIPGNYPNWRVVMPTIHNPQVIIIPARAAMPNLLAWLQKIHSHLSVILSEVDGGFIAMTGDGKESGFFSGMMKGTYACNPIWLRDLLKTDGFTMLQANSEIEPGLATTPTGQFVIMPMRGEHSVDHVIAQYVNA